VAHLQLEGSFIEEAQSLLQQLSPSLQQAGISISKNVGTAYSDKLNQLGERIIKEATYAAAEEIPPFLRFFYLTGTEREELRQQREPLPSWVDAITKPIVDPLIIGVKREVKHRINVVLPSVMLTLSLTVLTIFSLGYIVGVIKSKRKLLTE